MSKTKTTKKTETSPSNEEENEKSTNEAYSQGRLDGGQDVYKTYAAYLQKRMLHHFEYINDDLAKEIREIYILTKKNIK
jgi:hypothetical protein